MIDWKKYLKETDERKRWDMLQKSNRLSYDHVDNWIQSLLYFLKTERENELKDNERLIYNSFLMWLDYLVTTPKDTWEEQITGKAQQIMREMNGEKNEKI